MNTDQISYLIDIAKTGSINTTAKRMFSSQQAVSESIKRLERELNCTVLERSSRGVSLTNDGQFVLNHVTPMLEHYQMIQHHFQNSDEPTGKLHIGVALFAANIILTDLIFEMYRQHPHVTLFTEELSIEDIITDVLDSKLDFGIAGFSDEGWFSTKVIQSASLDIHPLYTDHIVCVMHKNNPLASEKTVDRTKMDPMKFTCYNNYWVTENPSRQFLHISSNTNIHKRFMQEENTVCMINSLAYKTFYPEKEFVAVPVADAKPMTMCLFSRKEVSSEEEELYQSFIQTAVSLTKQL